MKHVLEIVLNFNIRSFLKFCDCMHIEIFFLASRISSSSWRLSSKRKKEKTNPTSSCSSLPCSHPPPFGQPAIGATSQLPHGDTGTLSLYFELSLSFSQGKLTWIPAVCPALMEQCGGCRGNFCISKPLYFLNYGVKSKFEVIKPKVYMGNNKSKSQSCKKAPTPSYLLLKNNSTQKKIIFRCSLW